MSKRIKCETCSTNKNEDPTDKNEDPTDKNEDPTEKKEKWYATVQDLRDFLAELPDTPKNNALPLFYSIDDEGNDYRRVGPWAPDLRKIDKIKWNDIRVCDSDEEYVSDQEWINAVQIN